MSVLIQPKRFLHVVSWLLRVVKNYILFFIFPPRMKSYEDFILFDNRPLTTDNMHPDLATPLDEANTFNLFSEAGGTN